MSDLKSITVLVPGKLHPRSVARIAETFNLVQVDRITADAITPDIAASVRGVAASPALGGSYVGPDFMRGLPKLEIVANFGVGYDGVDAAFAGKNGVVVTNTPDVLTEEVADTAIGLLINTVRELARAEVYLRQGKWATEGAYHLTGSLRGRSIGIFGMGRIGQAIAKRLEAFGLPVSYHNRRPVDGLTYRYHDTLEGLAAAVDTLISIAPGTASTEKAVNAGVLKALGENGVFVNIGRGSTVDEDALVHALGNGVIKATGLNVFADEPNVRADLMQLPNATLLPHVGSASVYTRNAMADLVVDNLVEWFSRGQALTPVPETVHIAQRK